MPSYSNHRRRVVLGVLTVLLAVAAVVSLATGALPGGLWQVAAKLPAALAHLASPSPAVDQLTLVIAEIRLPRLLLGALTGAGLALSGALMQGLFRNPLADPGLLGVSAGAALGAVAGIVLVGEFLSAAGAWLLPGLAFAGGLASLLIVHRLAAAGGRADIATMLLAGIALNAMAGAGIGLLSYIADDAELRDLIFWSLGSLQITDWRKLTVALAVVVPALVILPRFAGALNANLLGEREAGHLGIDLERVKRRIIAGVALVVGALVGFTGVIGFVGLVVPHLLRLVIGPDHRLLLPASALAGGALLVAADIVARIAIAPAEIPIGIITALLGGPFFLWLLVRVRRARFLA